MENLETESHAGEKITADRCNASHLDDNLDDGDFLSDDISETICGSSSALDPPSNFMVGNGNVNVCALSVDDNLAMAQSIRFQVKSRTSVLPLEVALGDDLEKNSNIDQATVSGISSDLNACDEAHEDKGKIHLRRKAKEEMLFSFPSGTLYMLFMVMCSNGLICHIYLFRLLLKYILNENSVPTSADDFEKLVRSSPNCSYLWIFLLSLRGVPKAPAIAERALTTIIIREEGKKLNVSVAYLNLENEYGNPRKVYCLEPEYILASRVWLRYIQSLLKQGNGDTQDVVSRALLSLGQWKHIKFISQAAILEFKYGMLDRSCSMFEKVLTEYPKRIDLWNVYLDKEIHMKDHELVCAFFERATSLNLLPKKMKFLFKKYLNYEKLSGDEEHVDSVKRKVMEYVENSLGS